MKSRILASTFFAIFFVFGAISATPNPQNQLPVVVLDPGHGWRIDDNKVDPGAVYEDLVEKDIALDIAIRTRELLVDCPIDVYLTREEDDFEHSFNHVSGLVNVHNPTIVVSIHINSSIGASGTEAWHTVGGFNDDGSIELAGFLSNSVANRLPLRNRGVKPENENRHGGLYIHHFEAPSALIELAFIQEDADLLRNRRPDFAYSIAEAITQYFNFSSECISNPSLVENLPSSDHTLADSGSANHTKKEIDGFGMGSSSHLRVGSERLSEALDELKLMNVRWVREEFPWSEI